MELGITIPLQKFLKLKQPPYGTCPDPLFCWDVHRVKIANGRVLMIGRRRKWRCGRVPFSMKKRV